MSKWINEYMCPGFMYVPRKPWKFGNEYHNAGCSDVGQAMTNVLSFGNISRQYPVQYLQESDTFQVQLSDQINIFGHEKVDNLYVLGGNQP